MDIVQKRKINRMLGENGFPPLEDPRGLFAAMAFMIRGHDHFRQLLVTCEPIERQNMYNALAPNLRFQAKPLDVYISEAARDAEARQLPTIAEDGTLHEFKVPEIGAAGDTAETVDTRSPAPDLTDQFIQKLETLDVESDAVLSPKTLDVECHKCLATAQFRGYNRGDTVRRLREAGWRYDVWEGGTGEVCPDCPGPQVN